MRNDISLTWHNENTFTVTFSAAPSVRLTQTISSYQQAILQHWGHAIVDCVPAYDSLMIVVHPLYEAPDQLALNIAQLYEEESTQSKERHPDDLSTEQHRILLFIPVLYDKSVAPDLQRVADSAQLTCDEVIELHFSTDYTVCALGFAPGFPYLGFVDKRIATPRLATPRKSVPEGAVGIAGSQTGVYPRQSPGGWNIIGRTPVPCFDISRPIAQASLFFVGQHVRFYPISQSEYDAWPKTGVGFKANSSTCDEKLLLHGKGLVL